MTQHEPGILEEIYCRYRRELFGMALTILGRRQLAEDAVHEGFVNLCRGPNCGRDPTAYVFTVVRRVAINYLRKQKSQDRLHHSLYNGHSSDAFESNTANVVDVRETHDLLRDAVDRLPPDQRQLIVLKIHADLTFNQIGKILGLPLKTVATRYRRTLRKLEEQLKGKV